MRFSILSSRAVGYLNELGGGDRQGKQYHYRPRIGIMLPHLIGANAHNTRMQLVQGNHIEIYIFVQQIVL